MMKQTNINDMSDQALMALAFKRLKSAIKETERVSHRVRKTVKMFEGRASTKTV